MEESRSSTFSFDTLRIGRFRFPRAAATALAVIVCCEGLLHLCQDVLPDAVVWGQGSCSAKVALVEERAKNGAGEVDALILGPSHAAVGISPSEMAREAVPCQLRAFNGALNGRTYTALELLLKEVTAVRLF